MYTGDYVTRGLVRHIGAGAQGVAACLTAVGILVFCLYVRRRLAAVRKEGGMK
jgi:hypothetical protein